MLKELRYFLLSPHSQKPLSLLATLFSVTCLTWDISLLCKAIPTNLASSSILIVLCILALFLVIIERYYDVYLVRFCIENKNRTSELFLHGEKAWRWLETGAFTRIGRYVGQGLCYEAAALEMFAWKDFKKSQLVYANAYCTHPEKGIGEHCWIEIKKYGIWWVIDPTWTFPATPEPRLLHNLANKVHNREIIPYEEFWESEFSKRFYDLLCKKETSYLFGELALYSRYNTRQMTFQALNIDEKLLDGENMSYLSYMRHTGKNPITKRIITEFIASPKRLQPKSKTFRKGKIHIDSVEKAKDLFIKTVPKDERKNKEIFFTGIKTFEIREIDKTDSPA